MEPISMKGLIEAENTISSFYQVFVMVLIRISGKLKKSLLDPYPQIFIPDRDPDPAERQRIRMPDLNARDMCEGF